MIAYSQELKTTINTGKAAAPTRPSAPAAPLIVLGIPFDQPNPSDSRVLRSMALYLSGIRQVTVDSI